MGSLFLQLGQAGNQIGLQLMDYLDSTSGLYAEGYLKRSDQNTLHSIMIDTEPKTIKPIIENRKRYPFIDTKNVLYFQHGRGNNWALGYMDENMQHKKQSQKVKLEKPQQFNKLSHKLDHLIDIPTFMGQTYLTNSEKDSVPTSTYLKENSEILESVMDMLRKEIERIDYFIGINMIYSLGGGTGNDAKARYIG